jgi:hypothetical protein
MKSHSSDGEAMLPGRRHDIPIMTGGSSRRSVDDRSSSPWGRSINTILELLLAAVECSITRGVSDSDDIIVDISL